MIRIALAIGLALGAAACTPPTVSLVVPTPTAVVPVATVLPTATSLPAATPTVPPPPPPDLPDEAILLLEPGPVSHVMSPIRVSGIADPAFEQTLVARVVLDDGTEVTQQPVMIQAEIGQRGPFSIDIPFVVFSERNAYIQVYQQSARDGGTLHLASVPVVLTPLGPAQITAQTVQAERIAILQPERGAEVSGGVARVEGIGIAGFEQTLLVEVLDAEGNRVGAQAVILQGVEPGVPGPFAADVAYTAGGEGPGRIIVRDISPAFGGDIHLTSVEIELKP